MGRKVRGAVIGVGHAAQRRDLVLPLVEGEPSKERPHAERGHADSHGDQPPYALRRRTQVSESIDRHILRLLLFDDDGLLPRLLAWRRGSDRMFAWINGHGLAPQPPREDDVVPLDQKPGDPRRAGRYGDGELRETRLERLCASRSDLELILLLLLPRFLRDLAEQRPRAGDAPEVLVAIGDPEL